MLKTNILCIGVLMLCLIAHAEVPQLINYQGRLTDPAGDPVADGEYSMVFTIYDTPSGTPGKWYSGMQPVQVVNGLFTYQLGSVNPLPDSLFEQDTLLYLGIRVGSEPENRYLCHSSINAPEMVNIYSGNVTTDENGEAVVALPDYFEALNKDFRYQLTVIGSFTQAIISEEISENQFAIKTDRPYIKVSWQVTGTRQDPWAKANHTQVDVDKPDEEKGLYLHPEAYNLGLEMQIHYEQNKAALETAERSE